MEIRFRSSKLEKLCNSKNKMLSELGQQNAKRLQQRLGELGAAENLEVMRYVQAARCHELTQNRMGQLAVDLKHPSRLVFHPDHDPIPQKLDGGLDWKEVTAICIHEIVDYH